MAQPPMGEPAPTFGDRLRCLREAAGLSQEELAERAGLSAKGLAALERGRRRRPYPHTVRRLAAALDLSEADRAELIAAVPSRGGTADGEERQTLPGFLDPLIGREREAVAAWRLLRRREVRLLTLTGPGGVGKTRLAIAVAAAAADAFPDGVAFVSLAPLRDAEFVPTSIVRALGLSLRDNAPPLETLTV